MSLERALEGDVGAVVRQVAVVSLELPGRFEDPLRGVRVRDALLERIPQVRGVVRVGWASTLPLGRGNHAPFQVEGKTSDVVDTPDFDTNVVSPGFFDVLSGTLVEGRVFDNRDTPRATPVVVVDELLARRHFAATAIGRHLVDGRGTLLEIVGIVRSGRYSTLQQPPQPTVYYPATQEYLWRGHLVVRTSPNPALVLDDVRAAVNQAGGMLGCSNHDTRSARRRVAVDGTAHDDSRLCLRPDRPVNVRDGCLWNHVRRGTSRPGKLDSGSPSARPRRRWHDSS